MNANLFLVNCVLKLWNYFHVFECFMFSIDHNNVDTFHQNYSDIQ